MNASAADLRQQLAQAFQLFSAGDHAGAERVLGVVLEAAPNEVNALNLLAGVKRARGDAAGALAAFDAALGAAPNAAPIVFNRANLLMEMGRFDEAAAGYRAALELRPDHAETHANLARALFNHARVLQGAERGTEAVAAYDELLRFAPDDAGAWDNRGVALHDMGRFADALASFDRALALAPDRAETHSNRGLVLFDLARQVESVAAFDRALALKPGDASLRYNRGMAALRAHDLHGGWPGFEARWEAALVSSPRRDAGEPAWRGEKLDGPLRIWPEQGIGDEVLFARLAPLARERTEHVILQCAPRLAPLFARAIPDLEVRPADTTAPAAAQISSASLGAVLDVAAVNGATFLRADEARSTAIRVRYEALAQGRPIIGIAWVSKSPRRGEHKSAPLEAWGALLARDALFVSLQYGDVSADVAGRDVHVDAEVHQLADLDAFAAQIAAMDCVVSVSNTTVHLAGALGVPTLVMPPPARGRLWYWGFEGEATPWYQSVRIVRRAVGEDWAAQIARAAAMLDGV